MNISALFITLSALLGFQQSALAEITQRVVDISTRPGVTQRFLYLKPDNPKASAILFAGGHGGLEISQNGDMGWGKGNFLVRSRRMFAEQDLSVAVIDAPSDRQRSALIGDFRWRPEHVADIKAVIAWLKREANLPVWLIGTSLGTQSAAFISAELSPGEGGPDGLVLTSTVLSSRNERPVTDMPLDRLSIPVLVVHHVDDGCRHCSYEDVPQLMKKLEKTRSKELLSFQGGISRGDPCGPFAHHGFNGIEKEVVAKTVDWMLSQ